MTISLPIEQHLSSIQAMLAEHTRLILVAQPGAGKTTRVPLMLLSSAWAQGQRLLLVEPRRVAARLAATFMASQLNEQVGETVGYRMRGDSNVGPNTRLEVVTQGVLTRILQDDPLLEGVASRAVIIRQWAQLGKMDDVDPRWLIFLIWSATQHYTEYSAQVTGILGEEALSEADLASICQFLEHVILKGCGITSSNATSH